MRRRRWGSRPIVAPAILAAAGLLLAACTRSPRPADATPHRVYVMLGFHTNFYHSWRGDTPDEAGFGTDIRVVRDILRRLDAANARGLDARGYWEFDNHFTLETILPVHAPDIIDGVRRRHAAGLDDVLVAPYNNGVLSAMTADEVRAALHWAVTNPWGSGVADLFGAFTPIVRPQEYMVTTGILPLLHAEGMRGLILAYSTYPFTAFSNFVPVLPPAQRYGVTTLRLRDGEAPTLLLPAASVPDVINFESLERWMLALRELQTSGQVRHDLLIHLNIDADAETWVAADLPAALRWIPNTGGLQEYIDAVNRYDWAAFTTPAEYLAAHAPEGEVVVRQDMADGAWDGNYSWAEKASSQEIWTLLEQSRLAERRAAALARGAPEAVRARVDAMLHDGRDSSFFHRLRGLSTTHFGMSTPAVNEERQAVAEQIAGAARDRALAAQRLAADAIARGQPFLPPLEKGDRGGHPFLPPLEKGDRGGHPFLPPLEKGDRGGFVGTLPSQNPPSPPFFKGGNPRGEGSGMQAAPDVDAASYRFRVHDTRTGEAPPARVLVRVPVVLPDPPPPLALFDATGAAVELSLVNLEPLGSGQQAAEIWLDTRLRPGEWREYRLAVVETANVEAEARDPARLANDRVELALDSDRGVRFLRFDGEAIGADDFLSPFITYGAADAAVRYPAGEYEIDDLAAERHRGVQRVELRTRVSIATPDGTAAARIVVRFTLPAHAPWLVADVAIDYPHTAKRDLLHTVMQKLRRYLDLGWVEVAPFPLHPRLNGTRERPLRVWKHNYLGVTSSYDLDYAAVNPRNAEIDAFNHQVTAGWVAVSDRRRGLLVGECADARASYAFAPMRLREHDGRQQVWINPFGSYYGRQMDYAHLGGNGLGSEIALRKGAQFRPNAPSYNGTSARFSLLLAPYAGDAPPPELQADAEQFFYPPAVVYLHTPPGIAARLPEDVREIVRLRRRALERERSGPLPVPASFLANPTAGAVDLVWDEPADPRVDGYDVQWRPASASGWQSARIAPARRHRVQGLTDGARYAFRLRAAGDSAVSDWTATAECTVGPVPPPKMTGEILDLGPALLLRILYHSLAHVWGT